MSDLISRRAVDDAIYDYSRSCDVNYAQIMEYIDKIPSAENKGEFDGMTNGEVIQTLFPEVKVEVYGSLVRCVFIEHEFTTTLEWWNSPYEKGGE